MAWSDLPASTLLVLLPHDGLDSLAVLTASSDALTGSDLLPGPPAAYASLQHALQDAAPVPPP